MKRPTLCAFILFCASAIPLFAQPGRLAGRVFDGSYGNPLEAANVFLANTPLGTATGSDGGFYLSAIPPGVYTVAVSMVGYNVQTRQLQVSGGDSLFFIFHLDPRPVQTEEVLTVGSAPVQWKKLFKLFEREFVGETRNAHETRILNPEVINLRRDSISHMLIASADSLIRVQNDALGYRLTIVLATFEWNTDDGGGRYLVYPRFETIGGATLDRREEWEKNRRRSFAGSLRHFLRSLTAGTWEHDGFTIHAGTLAALYEGLDHPVAAGDLDLTPMVPSGLQRLSFNGWWRVEYRGERRRTSYIALKEGFVILDDRGRCASPLLFEMIGDWTEDRVAEILPLD